MNGLNKAQRSSLTVACPVCGAKVAQVCKRPVMGFSHVERFRKANRIGSTGRRGDPFAP